MENFNTSEITLRRDALKQELHREITGNLAHQRLRGNKLFYCIRTPLKRVLVCFTFHRKEIRLPHLHKRTNTGSSLDYMICFLLLI